MSNAELDRAPSYPDGGSSRRPRVRRGYLAAVAALVLAAGVWAAIAQADQPPVLHAHGTHLRWSPSGQDGIYRVVALDEGERESWKVEGTFFSPPAVPGATVTYEVKAAHEESAWSNQVEISYPAEQPAPKEPPAPEGPPAPIETPAPKETPQSKEPPASEKPSGPEGETGLGEPVEEAVHHSPSLKVGLIGGVTGWGRAASEVVRKATKVRNTRLNPGLEGWGPARELVSEGVTPLILYNPNTPLAGMPPARVAEAVKGLLPEMRELGLKDIELGNEVYYHGTKAWEYAGQYKAAHEALAGTGIALIADAWTDAPKPNGEWSQWESGGGWCVLFVDALGYVPDAWSFHPYGPMTADGFGFGGRYQTGWATVPRMIAYMKADHVYAPLNITEVGQPTYRGTDGNTPVSEAQQAADVKQYLTQSSEWGLESIYLYEGIDTGEGGYGLYKWPLQAKPSAAAFTETLEKLTAG
jgi:hypothetical protein